MTLFVASLFSVQSCKKDQVTSHSMSEKEVNFIVQSDLTSEDIITDVTNWMDGISTSSRPATNAFSNQMPGCVTVNHYVSGDTLYVDFVFDSPGCQMPNGRTYSGTIHVEKYRDQQSREFFLHVYFEQFYVDQIHVEGEFTRTRVWTNNNGNPQATVEFDLTLTWPNGDMAERSGTRTVEWIEGYDTHHYRADDVFLITGNWHVTTRNGVTYDVNILTPLRRELACRWIVSGTMEIIRNGDRYVLDFGDGTCDDQAILTLPNGQTRVIQLR